MNISNLHTLSIVAIAFILLLLLVGAIYAFFFFKKKNYILKRVGISESKSDSSEHHQENAYKLLPEAIVILNTQNQVIYLNLAAEEMLSCKLRRVMGRAHSDVFRLMNRETGRVMQGFFEKPNNYENIKRDCLLSTASNQTFSIDLSLINTSVSNEHRKILVLRNDTEMKALELKLSNLETYDPLTRLLKRKTFG